MIHFLQDLNSISVHILSLLPMSLIKAAVVFLVAVAVTNSLKRLHPRTKYYIWLLAVASLAVIPAVSCICDGLNVGVARVVRSDGVPEAVMTFMKQGSGESLLEGPARQFVLISPDSVPRRPPSGPGCPALVVLVWFLGAIVSTLPLISGCIRLRSLKRLATPMGRGAHRPMAAELSRKMGIRRGITLLQSNQCMVPFTCGVFRPLIILPADLSGWPLERLRAVMRHEMAHVKQGDYLVKLCARAVCSLFWYVPFAWVAYANLHAEQEKACDASIVESGDDPALYAHELVEIARAARKRPLGACIFMSREKSGLLKKRILSILESGGGKKMKKKTIPYVMVFLVVALAGIGSFAADREKQGFYVPKPSEEIYGTWINKEYSGDRASRCQKIVLHNWGYGEKWLKIEDEKSKWSWTYFFAAKWTDSDGNIWYKGLDQFPGWPVEYSLTKISKNGAVMECIYSRTEFPSESDLDPSHLAYLTYYRK